MRTERDAQAQAAAEAEAVPQVPEPEDLEVVRSAKRQEELRITPGIYVRHILLLSPFALDVVLVYHRSGIICIQ